jgi:thiol:disulfide interchange protein DsbA
MQRLVSKGLLLLCCLCAWSTCAAQTTLTTVTLKRGDNYREIAPQPVADAARIEVIDFFFYACPYCNELRPALETWRKAQGQDIQFRRIPAIRRDVWVPLARTYYTLETLGEVERLHEEVYKSYHDEKLHMSKPDVMADWAARQGIDRQRWLEAYHSADVTRKVEEARRLTAAYDIQGTPSIVVDGRYLTSGGLTDDIALVVPVVQALVDLARTRR